jgi:hypothetical protein
MDGNVRVHWFARKVQWIGCRPDQCADHQPRMGRPVATVRYARVARTASASARTPGRIDGSAMWP